MTPPAPTRRLALALALCVSACLSQAAFAADAKGIAVVYPDIGEPFRSVFLKIIEGIEEQAKGRVVTIPVAANVNLQDLASDLKKQDVRVVIALGRNGLKAASGIDQVGVVAGGVLSVPEADAKRFTVHSLAPDPVLLFGQLKSLLPNTRRILVVHDSRQNAWLIRRAKEAAHALGFEMVVQDAEDIKTAFRFYQEAFAGADPKRDVIWLPQDSTTVDDATVLPFVLQESWNRGVAVFSSSVAHVKRGALFALYPNNRELGKSLAQSATAALGPGHLSRGMLPLKEVLVAANLRTASHLGIQLGSKQQSFDLIFPEP
jgi:putative tryptophan/tyrosine transport system substrate-binding protein